ncbi:cation diffusion facilitator family transporter [Niveibacterium sp. SC-1]|uniref:cation diffusion facilitator family transporter n=1 Tax=Niveibacterium sp. SC-1 TaxID=3135646 RepID=UPI0031204DA9
MPTSRLKAHHYAWISIGAALLTITLKGAAWWSTGSVGLLSDALESLVNLIGASFALLMLIVAAEPPDKNHPWGHSKAEYFSSGFEGTLIFVAALAIIGTGVPRFWSLRPLQQIDLGLTLSAASTVINFLTARLLARGARQLHSVALDADARHLMTDVWTTVGVVAGVILVSITGWLWLDPLLACLVALHILREGWSLMRRAVGGLMDEALDPEELRAAETILSGFAPRGVAWKDLRTRRAGQRRFIHMDLLVPSTWSVRQAHDVADEVEATIADAISGAVVSTHIEPIDAPAEG